MDFIQPCNGTFGVDGLFTGLPVKHQFAAEMPSYAVMCEYCRAAKGSAFLAEVDGGEALHLS